MLISKSITSQPGPQTIGIHILHNNSRRKGNQAVKFGQLIEYKMGPFLLKNHTQNVLQILFPDPYLKIKIEDISGSIV